MSENGEAMAARKRVPRPPAVTAAPPNETPEATEPVASDLFNRELSWLDFDRRVLAEAADPTNLPLERLKFLAICESNLDEFMMKRVGGLQEQVAGHVSALSPDGRTPSQQLAEIGTAVAPLAGELRRQLRDELAPLLARHGLELVLRWEDLAAADRDFLRGFFDANLFPILTPLGVDTAHPFPFISNLSLSLAVSVRQPGASTPRFARVKVPPSLPRWTRIGESMRFVPLEEVIAHNLDRLFPGMELLEVYAFRVIRNVAVQRHEDAAADLLEAIQEELAERRFAPVVRLEVVPAMPEWMRELLRQELEIGRDEVGEVEAPLGLRDLAPLTQLPLDAIRERPWRSVVPPRLAPGPKGEEPDVFATIAAGDLLVHHPYDSFYNSVQRFVQAAARDPQVLAIKQTLYRTSRASPTVKTLIDAAESGKQVAVIVELKASFEEARNIEWAEALEEAGAHVAYGVVGLKTHAKASLVVRQERDGLRTYSHIATGNYNTDTAELYTDLGLFTCRPEIGADLAQLFNVLTGFVHQPTFARLLVAPFNMRSRSRELIEREVAHARAGRAGRIIAKMNSLEDPQIVRALYEAAQAGVEIDLVVRGLCRLRAGVPGLSERIRVRSIVGRFLEHARIFYFANGGAPEYYLGSADWMSRNLDWRVEAMVPVETPELQGELAAILELQLADNCKAWDLQPDGTWTRRQPAPGEPRRSSQQLLMERAQAHAARPGASDSLAGAAAR